MSINLTLIFEILAFLAFVYSFKRFLWKPIIGALEARERTIADGLAAAEQGRKDLEQAEVRAGQALAEARRQAGEIVEHANRRAGQLVEEARNAADLERIRTVERAQAEIDQASRRAREVLRGRLAQIAAEAAGKILEREIDPKVHAGLVEKMATEL